VKRENGTWSFARARKINQTSSGQFLSGNGRTGTVLGGRKEVNESDANVKENRTQGAQAKRLFAKTRLGSPRLGS
jgi:hypothetical protein